MNNTTIYQQLQQHYQKLQMRLVKAQTKGRSQSFQQRLLGRIQRCSMQMKHLGAGMAVIAALGGSSPVLGQEGVRYSFIESTSTPFDSIPFSNAMGYINFVDIDGDDDLDAFMDTRRSVSSYQIRYFENIGNTNTANFVERTGTANILGGLTDMIEPSFVDIDADGDLDCFVSSYGYFQGNTKIDYYENTGDSANAVLTLRTGADNPLLTAETYISNIAGATNPSGVTSFADVDGDGDMDCLINVFQYYYYGATAIGADRLLYYKNTGKDTMPTFQLQTAANNPFLGILNSMPANSVALAKVQLFDGEINKDGDVDAWTRVVNTPSSYYVNTRNGSSTAVNFVDSIKTPFDSLDIQYGVSLGQGALLGIADLNGDGKLDAIVKASNRLRYFENVSILTKLDRIKAAQSLKVYPNPSIGTVRLEEPLTGELHVYNTLGQEVYAKELEEAQQLDLSSLSQGVYLLYIHTPKQDYQQTITIQK